MATKAQAKSVHHCQACGHTEARWLGKCPGCGAWNQLIEELPAARSLTAARVPFETPPAHQLAERLASVLEVIYLIFNEGYAATAGNDWMRPALAEEALRLGRVLAGQPPVDFGAPSARSGHGPPSSRNSTARVSSSSR